MLVVIYLKYISKTQFVLRSLEKDMQGNMLTMLYKCRVLLSIDLLIVAYTAVRFLHMCKNLIAVPFFFWLTVLLAHKKREG